MKRRLKVVGFALLCMVMGSCGSTLMATAKPPKQPAYDVVCTGNGPGGFRRCDLDFTSPVNRISVHLLVNGEEHTEFNYWPRVK